MGFYFILASKYNSRVSSSTIRTRDAVPQAEVCVCVCLRTHVCVCACVCAARSKTDRQSTL